MKVLYTGTLDVNAGGPAFSTYNTMRGLNAIGVETHVLMFEMGQGGRLIGTDVPIHFAKRPMENVFGYSPSYKREVTACGDFDIYQTQGIWQYYTYAMVDVARRKGKPYIITPAAELHDMDCRGKRLMRDKYSIEAVAQKLRDVYRWILKEGQRPDFVHLGGNVLGEGVNRKLHIRTAAFEEERRAA